MIRASSALLLVGRRAGDLPSVDGGNGPAYAIGAADVRSWSLLSLFRQKTYRRLLGVDAVVQRAGVVGPIFTREVLTAPRQLRHYLVRAGYVGLFFVLMYTAGQATFGWQEVRNISDFARFGSLLFQIFSLLQLTSAIFFSMLFAAGNVAQEKDRHTLVLLLMTDLRDREIVLGKLLSSLLLVGVLLATSLPVFVLVHMLGGVDLQQIGWSFAICVAAAYLAGSWGVLVAFWREKTFQTLAIAVVGSMLYLGLVEAVRVAAGSATVGPVAAWLNPYRAMLAVLAPLSFPQGLHGVAGTALASVVCMVLLALVLNAVAVLRLRVWNPSRAVYESAKRADEQGRRRVRHRRVWDRPIIWREICTRAYGRRVFVIKLAYVVIAGVIVAYAASARGSGELVLGMISPAGMAIVLTGVLSLMLINAQAVTALTSERDGRTLELLLATNVTAKEFVYGKLGGSLYNGKELIAVPLLLAAYEAWRGTYGWETFVYVVVGYLVLVVFSAMLGLHSGLSYDNSRAAIANSLGTLFFLFVGIFIFMMLLVEARSSFFLQFQSFVVFIGLGSLGLYGSLTHKNPSAALTISAAILPFLTFYAITEFLLNGTLGVCLAITTAYGFATLAMLVPAVSEFDVALGRTTLDQG